MDGGQFHYPQCCHATLDQMQRIRKSEDMRTSGKVSQFYTYNLLGLLIDLLEESKAKVFFYNRFGQLSIYVYIVNNTAQGHTSIQEQYFLISDCKYKRMIF